MYSHYHVEEQEKQLGQYEVIGSDKPPKPKGKRSPGAKERIRQQDKASLHSPSGYSPTDDLYVVQQQFQPNHRFGVPLNEPRLPSHPSAEPLSFIGYSSIYGSYSTPPKSQLKHVVCPYELHLPSQPSALFGSQCIQGHSRESGKSRSRESETSRSRESETSRSRESETSRSRESETSRSRESETSRSRESETSRSRESETSRSRESGNSREPNQHKSKQQRKHERTQRAIKEAIKQDAIMEAPYLVEAFVKSVQSSYNKGQLDMTEGREQLLSSGKKLLWAAAEAYARSDSSWKVFRKLSSALDKCSLAYWVPPQLKPLANLISLNNIKRVLEVLKCMYGGKMSRVDACTQIFDILGSSVFQTYGCYFGGLVGSIVGAAVGGPGGAVIGLSVGACAGGKLGKSLWELIKKAIGYIINYIGSL